MLSNQIRRALPVVAALALAACGGGDKATVSESSSGLSEEKIALETASRQAPDEADAQAALLRNGLPALLSFRNPEFAIIDFLHGRQLFERESFDGNGRTCLTCHSRTTGTVSPHDAQHRFAVDPHDPLFTGDGSDDGQGNGATRMLQDATILVRIRCRRTSAWRMLRPRAAWCCAGASPRRSTHPRSTLC